MRETWVWSLGWEDPLEKGKATHFSTLAWRIPWIQSMGSQRVGHNWATFTFTFLSTKWHSTLVALKCVSICTCVHSQTYQLILHKNLNQQQFSRLAMSAHKQYYLPSLPVFLGQWNQKEIRFRGWLYFIWGARIITHDTMYFYQYGHYFLAHKTCLLFDCVAAFGDYC